MGALTPDMAAFCTSAKKQKDINTVIRKAFARNFCNSVVGFSFHLKVKKLQVNHSYNSDLVLFNYHKAYYVPSF